MQTAVTNQQQITVPTLEQMHAAIRARDAAWDGRFFFGVVTTGVYCRPSCPARPAKPENIRFFEDAASATAAGFRPCKKCRPDEFGDDVEKLIVIARYIEAHADERLTLAQLCDEALAFQPLLPADEAALHERVEALSQWCQGFLYGLGESGWSPGPAASEDVQEILRDLYKIARAGVSKGEENEEGERAYAELVEFVRVSVLLIRAHLSESPNQ